MRLLSLKLEDFRNISEAKLNFGQNNILFGLNAQGKTNILEAINFLSSSKSFKTKQEQWAIKIKKASARVEGVFSADNQEENVVSVVLQNTGTGLIKTLQINKTKTSKKEFLKQVPLIIFTPDETGLIKVQSTTRRELMNNILNKTNITYSEDYSLYNKALKQRNQLLLLIKQNRVGAEELGGWDVKLAELGCKLIKARQDLIAELNKYINIFFKQLGGEGDVLKLNYINNSRVSLPEEYLRKLKDAQDLDVRITHTSFGPHRDDLQFLLNNQEAVQLSSQGQFRLIVLALKLAEGEYLKEVIHETPIYLMDDIFSELDEEKIRYINDLFKNNQSFFTTTNPDVNVGKKVSKFLVKNGIISDN